VLSEASKVRFPSSRRLVRVLIPLVLAVLLFGLLVWPGLADTFNFRLSTIGSFDAANPDIAAAGDNIGVVWSEGYNKDPNTKEWGRVYLKTADVTNGWAGRVRVFDANNNVWGREPRLAFNPSNSNQVHLVWAQASGCGGSGVDCQWTSVWHTRCNVSNRPATCISPSQVATGRSDASTPDVAVDSGGGVHVVWREGSDSIRYCKKGNCGSPVQIGTGQHPSLVFAANRLYAVWDAGDTIEYVRDDSPGNSTWNPTGSRSWWDPNNPLTPQDYEDASYPAIEARDNAIYVVWAIKRTGTNQYALAFDFYNGSSATWQDTSGANIGFTIPGNDQDFAGTTRYESNIDISYLWSLQPDVFVTSTGAADDAYAHVVWHGRETGEGGSAYEIWYTYLPGINASGWNSVLEIENQNSYDAGSPAVAIGSDLSETHVAYMLDADGKGAGGKETLIDVWYIGANSNRDDDPDRYEGSFLPVILKND